MITAIYIGVDKLDLHKDDNIVLKSSIAEIEDVSKIFTDSTNNFSVPATDNNNRIFKHFYNANLLNGWDVFNKVDAVIELDGFIYKQGKIKLNSVTTKSNIPIDYEIQYYGNLTALKDILGDDKLEDLDFTSLNFSYTDTDIISKLTTSIGTDLIATTLTEKRLIYDSYNSVQNTPTVRNIASNGLSTNNGLYWQDVMISIKNIKIIEAIESKYGITFSRDFFSKDAFDDLYLLLNGKGNGNKLKDQIVFNGTNTDATLENNRILLSTNLSYSETDRIVVDFSCTDIVQDQTYTFTVKSNDREIFKDTKKINTVSEYILYKSDFTIFENLTFFISANDGVNFNTTIKRYIYSTNFFFVEQLAKDIDGLYNIENKLPDLKIIDYLKGIFQMFKCIAYLENDIITIKTLQDYYDDGKVKEFTKYIDFSEIPISTGSIFNEINYKFKEPKSILAKEFFNNNGVYYGDLEYKIVDLNGKKVDGETINIELPFENMVYEKLYDLSGAEDVNFIYGYLADENQNPVTVTAHLHYVFRIGTTSAIKIIKSSGTTTTSLINVPIHTFGITNPTYSTVFGEEFNEYNGVLIQNTLYTNYHKDYIVNAFNENKRLYQFKAKELPIYVLLSLKLNDILIIKDQYYRINKYEINLTTKEMMLECYNIKEL
jgi:hypothetical protein